MDATMYQCFFDENDERAGCRAPTAEVEADEDGDIVLRFTEERRYSRIVIAMTAAQFLAFAKKVDAVRAELEALKVSPPVASGAGDAAQVVPEPCRVRKPGE